VDRVAWSYPSAATVVGQARAAVGSAADAWELPQPVIDDLLVIVSELATNAVIHARSPVRITLDRLPNGARIEVYDEAASLPEPQRPDLSSGSGRGLWLVGALSSRWGCDEVDNGKKLWAEVGAATT
jgi:anti-sigma regulatory factor (Ser/Thr protein kinase)